MKNKKLISLTFVALIIVLGIIALIINSNTKTSECNISSINEVVREKQDTNEEQNTVEDANKIQENIVLESSKKTQQEKVAKSDVKKAATINNTKTTETEQSKSEIVSNKYKNNITKKTEKEAASSNVKENETVTNQTKEKAQETKKNESNNNNPICNHNSNEWFDSYEKAKAKVDTEFDMWQQKYDNGECTKQEFLDGCPIGYEIFRCSCGKYKVIFAYV